MLTKRQNLLETIRGGKPDRFVNQYEAFDCDPGSIFGMIMGDPIAAASPRVGRGEPPVKDGWGVTRAWPPNVPGAFPVHDENTRWSGHHPVGESRQGAAAGLPQSEWDKFKPKIAAVDRNEVFVTIFGAPEFSSSFIT